jgi:hypothetical protein
MVLQARYANAVGVTRLDGGEGLVAPDGRWV